MAKAKARAKTQNTAPKGKSLAARKPAKKAKKKQQPKINRKKLDPTLFYDEAAIDRYMKYSMASINEVRVFCEADNPQGDAEQFIEPFRSSQIDKLLFLDRPSHPEEMRQFYANLTSATGGGWKTMVNKHEFPVTVDTVNKAIGCTFTTQSENVKRVCYRDKMALPPDEIFDRMRALFGNPAHEIYRPKSYSCKGLGVVDKMCYELIVNNLISAGHSTENTINGMALFTHLKKGDVIDPGYVVLTNMVDLERAKTGKRIPYGNVITKLIQDAGGSLKSAPEATKYYNSVYFAQRHFRCYRGSWEDRRSMGEGGVPTDDEVEGAEGDRVESSNSSRYIKRTIWRRISEHFGTLFAKVDKLQTSVNKLQEDMSLVKKACHIPEKEEEVLMEEGSSEKADSGDESESDEEDGVDKADVGEESSSEDESCDDDAE